MDVPALAGAGLPDDANRLDQLRAEYPGFGIWREVTGDHARYVARRLNPGTHPHSVVTPDLTELRTALASSAPLNGSQVAGPGPAPGSSGG